MPRSKPCPSCGRLAEVKSYVTAEYQEGKNDPDAILDVWECECGWAEDVKP